MVAQLSSRLGGLLPLRPPVQPVVTYADLRRSYDRLSGVLAAAGTDRAALLDAVTELKTVGEQLRVLARRHRQEHGRTHAVRLADEAVQEVRALEYDVRPLARYIWTDYLRTRLWSAARDVERAAITLRWEGMETSR